MKYFCKNLVCDENYKNLTLAKVSDRKNSTLLNSFYSGIFIRTKQFHSYPNELVIELRIPIRSNPR